MFWDSDWQGLCELCRNSKSAQEQISYRTGPQVIVKGCGPGGVPGRPKSIGTNVMGGPGRISGIIHLEPLLSQSPGVLVLAGSPDPEAAKDFLRHLMRPEQLGPYIQVAQGRWYPTKPRLAENPVLD
jgi:hypothetical protein